MRTTTSCKNLLITFLRNEGKYVPKSQLERLAKSKSYLADTADRRLREMTCENPQTKKAIKMVNLNIVKKEIKGQVHYKFVY